MSTQSRALAGALKLLLDEGEVAASRFGIAQTYELDQYAKRTNAICQRAKGTGRVICLVNRKIVELSYRGLRPRESGDTHPGLPDRARNIAMNRSSKDGQHRHESYHLLIKPIGAGATWSNGHDSFQITDAAHSTGIAALTVSSNDAWVTDGRLWLVENQALFDDLSWLPTDAVGSIMYYHGVIDGRLLNWLTTRRRHDGITLFPDYDGVGLSEFAKLATTSANKDAIFWLFPGWQTALKEFGSASIWRDTLKYLDGAYAKLRTEPAALDQVRGLIEHLQRTGLAMEQETAWIPLLETLPITPYPD